MQGVAHLKLSTTSTSSRYLAIIDLFSTLGLLTFCIRSMTATDVVLNSAPVTTGKGVLGVWLAFPYDNFALVGWTSLLADDFELGVGGVLLKATMLTVAQADNFVFTAPHTVTTDIVGSVRNVVPGLVSSSTSVVLDTKIEIINSTSANMSDGSSVYALGTFAKVTGSHLGSGSENSVVVFGLSVA